MKLSDLKSNEELRAEQLRSDPQFRRLWRAHRIAVPLASLLPERLLTLLDRHLALHRDLDGWSFWLDASYLRWVRRERRRE
jgi:hypothetical protein